MDLLIKCLAADFYVLDLVLLLFSHAFSILEKMFQKKLQITNW